MRRVGQRVLIARVRRAAVAAPSRVEASAAVAVPFALSRAAMALSQRRFCGSAASAPEVISLDDIEVEAVGWSPDHAEHHDNNGGSAGAAGSHGDHSSAHAAAGGAGSTHHHHGVSTSLVAAVDTFSKSKVLNYLKRAFRDKGMRFDSQTAFETEPDTVEGPDGAEVAVYRSRVRLLCPAPHGLKIATGVASDPKDAEVVAAMHAERVLDALGVPLYALSGMQQKHAEAARKAGRWAPSPGDAVKPADTETPPGLVLASVFSAARGADQAAAEAAAAEEAENETAAAAGERASSDFMRDHYAHAAEAADFWERMSATQAASAAMYDTSEGNRFQPCALQSTRRSSTDLAITLPIIYDPLSRKRVAAFLGGADLDRIAKVANAPVKGTTYRMFTAELKVGEANGAPIVAVGKALEKKVAIDLAAMHAEMLIDFHGLLLFKDDPKKQAKHAALVRGCGRWAAATAEEAALAPSRDARLAPLPVKQTIGPASDDGLFGLAKESPGSIRLYTERIIMAHNHLALQWDNTFVEVLPPHPLLAEARTLVGGWLRSVGCRFPELFVATTMGEFVRVSLVLPLPSAYGVRGGNSVGRTTEQAADLCAMNALDVLCYFGVPVLADPAEQLALMRRRKALGLVANRPYVETAANEDGDLDADDPMAEFPMAPAPSPRARAPPGYYVEGNNERALPAHADVFAALADNPEHTATLALGTAETLVTQGNEQKPNVQAYCRRMRDGKDAVPTVVQTGSSPTVRNVVYLRVPLPADRFGPGAEVMAVGHGLKKRDADRMCWMHAYATLEANGIPELSRQKEVEVRELRAKKKAAVAAVPPPMSKKKKKQLAQQQLAQQQQPQPQHEPQAGTPPPAGAAEFTPPPPPADSAGLSAPPTTPPSAPAPPATDAKPESSLEPKAATVTPEEPPAAKMFETPRTLPALMHPALEALFRREAEIAAQRRSRPKLFNDSR